MLIAVGQLKAIRYLMPAHRLHTCHPYQAGGYQCFSRAHHHTGLTCSTGCRESVKLGLVVECTTCITEQS
ncbi:hypothetical protein EFK68_03635 [Pseudomonas aeruginosa]|nr:hypothetical protein EFK68_03635 [Pseudomonas aeruginosa]